MQERLHGTLQQETASPPAATWRAQRQRLDRFRQQYNQERRHEALQEAVPDQYYTPSLRPYPDRLPSPEYGDGLLLRRVQISREFYWKHQKVFLGEALSHQRIGLEPISDRYYRAYFTDLELGVFDAHRLRMSPRERAKLVLDSSRLFLGVPFAPLRGLRALACNQEKCKLCSRTDILPLLRSWEGRHRPACSLGVNHAPPGHLKTMKISQVLIRQQLTNLFS